MQSFTAVGCHVGTMYQWVFYIHSDNTGENHLLHDEVGTHHYLEQIL